jgi:hypothetical protein
MVSATPCGRVVFHSGRVMVRTFVPKFSWKLLLTQPFLASGVLFGHILIFVCAELDCGVLDLV